MGNARQTLHNSDAITSKGEGVASAPLPIRVTGHTIVALDHPDGQNRVKFAAVLCIRTTLEQSQLWWPITILQIPAAISSIIQLLLLRRVRTVSFPALPTCLEQSILRTSFRLPFTFIPQGRRACGPVRGAGEARG